MANSVDLVIGAEAIKQVESLISKLSLADAELIKISQSASTASKGITGISTPSGLDKAVSNTSTLNAQLEKQNAIITKLHSDIAKKAEQSRLAEIRLQQQREKAFDSFEKNARKEQITAEKTNNLYNKTQTQINNLTKVYNDLAIRKERYNNLSANEEMRLGTLGRVTEKYNGILKMTDATIGKNQRNVGNYASGYNALGNSINQLSREAPAFANSVNTGFMALSNNFPALFDAINGIRDKNKMLVAEGKPTVSVLRSIAGAVFSWQTALSVGVTLLTLYGGQFIKWIGELSKGKEGISDLKLRMDTLNKSFEESSVKEAVKNVQELAINIDLAKQGFLDKDQVVKQYNDTIGKTTGFVTNLDDAEKELTANGDAYIKMTLYKAAANLALEDAAKQSLEAEKSRLKSLKEFAGQSADVGVSVGSTAPGFDPTAAARIAKKDIDAQKKKKNEEIKINTDAAQQNINIAKKFQQDAAKIAQYFDFNLFGDTKKEKVKKAKQEKSKREDLDHLESYIKPVGTIIEEINAEINRLTTEKIIANEAELPAINEQLRLLLELKKQLNAVPTAAGIPNIITPEVPKASMTKLKNDWKDTFNEIAESAQQAGDIIADFSEMNFKNEYARLESQKDISLKFAGDSAEAKAKIEEDYEKKRKEIANRENKAKQRQAIFNIAIDTAQAIMATLGKTGFAGLPTALILGAFGAAQIALVASQKIPEYWTGTDSANAGFAYTNERGAELHTDKHGNIKDFGDNKGARLTMMEQGDKVYTASETKQMLFNDDLNYMLNSKGISMPRNNGSVGMTAPEMDYIIGKHFAKIQTNNTTFDKNGFSSWSEKNGNRTKQNANRVSGIGFKV